MLDVGTQFRDYRILECLGQGGAGTVYRALQFGLQREVALKIALAGEAAVEERTRFMREARALAKLAHPNVVRILDFGEEGEALYFTMELAPGMSLDRRLREGRFCTLSEARDLARQLLEALVAVHESGVIHRDVKPANVLMRSENELVLSDFGLARDELGTRLTRTGQVMGTLPYLPPELGQRRPVDARGDLYQAGILFHELLTGQVPFDGQAVIKMLSGGALDPGPPARALAERFGPEAGAFFRRAVEPAVERRFQSAEKMLKALDTLDTVARRAPAQQAATAVLGRGGAEPAERRVASTIAASARPAGLASRPPGAGPAPVASGSGAASKGASGARGPASLARNCVIVFAACTAMWLSGPHAGPPPPSAGSSEVASAPATGGTSTAPLPVAEEPRPASGSTGGGTASDSRGPGLETEEELEPVESVAPMQVCSDSPAGAGEPPRAPVVLRPLGPGRLGLRLTDLLPDPSEEAELSRHGAVPEGPWRDSSIRGVRQRLARELRHRLLQETELTLLVSSLGSPWLYTAEVALVAPQEYEWARVIRPGASTPARVIEVNGQPVQSADGRVPAGLLVNGNNWLTFQLDGSIESSKRPVLLVRRRSDGQLAMKGAARWFPPIPDARALDQEVGRAITATPESLPVRQASTQVESARRAVPGSWEAALHVGLGLWSLGPKCRDSSRALLGAAPNNAAPVPTRGPFSAVPANGGTRSVTALLCLDTALGLNPQSSAVWSSLGRMYFESCRFSDAVRVLAFVGSQPPDLSTGDSSQAVWQLLPLALEGLALTSPPEAAAIDGLTVRVLAGADVEEFSSLTTFFSSTDSADLTAQAPAAATTEAYLDSLRLLPGNQKVLRSLRERRTARARHGAGRAPRPLPAR